MTVRSVLISNEHLLTRIPKVGVAHKFENSSNDQICEEIMFDFNTLS